MRKKFLIYTSIITSVALILMLILSTFVYSENNYELAKENIIELTEVVIDNFNGDLNIVNNAPEKVRITLLTTGGIVLADTLIKDVSTLDSHASRQEIIYAINGNPTPVIRRSDSLLSEQIYYAKKVSYGGEQYILRVSKPISQANEFIKETVPAMAVICVFVLLCSLVLSMFLSEKAVKPLKVVKESLESVNRGRYTPVMPTFNDQDMNKSINEINEIAEKLNRTMKSLADERLQLDFIINGISDGIIVFDNNSEIKLINTSAKNIFNVTKVSGKDINYLTDDLNIVNSVTKSITKKQDVVFECEIDGEYYLISLKVMDDDRVIMLVTNISAIKENQKIREEFFSNASHELKTPLTSISGFNELMKMKNKNDELSPYIEQIEKESGRMLSLISDMLSLSKLENSKEIKSEEVDLKALSNEVVESLSPLIAKMKVDVFVTGQASLFADKKHIYELIKNLTENAIKYNKEKGFVKIELSENAKEVKLKVEDSGIGLSSEDKSRVFERFYRVDKSRSRDSGGTGLGLSIVKHIAEKYNASIKVTSKLKVGTIIEVSFNK